MDKKNIIPRDIKKEITEIKEDNTSGSTVLSKKAAQVFLSIIEKNKDYDGKKLKKIINKTCVELIKSKPSMASIFTLCNNLLFDIENKNEKDLILKIVKKRSEDFLSYLDQSLKEISDNIFDLIKNDFVVLTHSKSSTVTKSLLNAKEKGRDFSVICTESRPMMEGVSVAKKLGEFDIKTRLIADSAAFLFIEDVDLIIVGADSIFSRGVVNKIGTKGLAIVSEKFDKKFYFVCSTDKILPKNYNYRYKNKEDPDEILKNNFKNVEPVNYYFDLTPLDYVKGVVTENGIYNSEKIMGFIKRLEVHDKLL